MVRSLRDSGALAAPPAPPNWRSSALMFAAALVCGAALYLAATQGLPSLLHTMDQKPPPVSFAKP